VKRNCRNIILVGDVREKLREIPDGVVDCCVTSPPYWGLRNYGTESQIWGGRMGCQHEWGKPEPEAHKSGLHIGGSLGADTKGGGRDSKAGAGSGWFCTICGAWRGSLGLEPTPELYIEHMVEICREIRRTLKPWGVFWLNMGDSFNGSGGAGGDYNVGGLKEGQPKYPGRKVSSLKPKDLCMIPHRLALALQADGWWVRMDVVWQKPNPMPESVNGWRWERHRIKLKSMSKDDPRYRHGKAEKGAAQSCGMPTATEWKDCPGCDVCTPNGSFILRKGSWRPTRSHEYVFMLTKSEEYYGDCEAVREPYTKPLDRWGGARTKETDCHKGDDFAIKERPGREHRPNTFGRNRRSVWSFATKPFKGAHFATFPTTLPDLCIRASTSEVGNCRRCGMPWTRVLVPTPEYKKLLGKDWSNPTADESEGRGHFKKNGGAKSEQRPVKRDAPSVTASYLTVTWEPSCDCIKKWKKACGADSSGGYRGAAQKDYNGASVQNPSDVKRRILEGMDRRGVTIGWKPSCDCPDDLKPVPAIVLDPFVGSGTTAATAKGLGRDYIGIELNETYAKTLAEPRIALIRRGSLLHPPVQKKKVARPKSTQQLEISC
jgi:DNA modification methylase